MKRVLLSLSIWSSLVASCGQPTLDREHAKSLLATYVSKQPSLYFELKLPLLRGQERYLELTGFSSFNPLDPRSNPLTLNIDQAVPGLSVLERRGYVRVERGQVSITPVANVYLTAKGKDLFGEGASSTYRLLLAKRRLTTLDGISLEGPRALVQFSWTYDAVVPEDLTDFLSARLAASGQTVGAQTSVRFRLYDDGWRVEE